MLIRESQGADPASRIIIRMADAMEHRGPDQRGVWTDADGEVALGFRRLAIIDLTPGGHQPMVSSNGEWVIVFNGEIYNHAELRSQLTAEGRAPVGGWKGRSDTESLLEAVANWGVQVTLERSNGMFALALWNRTKRQLWLARDRLGKKPLYHGRLGQDFVFGSELKVLRQHPAFTGRVDRHALGLYFRHSCVPGSHSIYEGIQKLPPGRFLRVDFPPRKDFAISEATYWNMAPLAETAANSFAGLTASAFDDRLHNLLLNAVKIRLQSDVPLGALLSGGIDSSLVTALGQAQCGRRLQTYSVGFEDRSRDESKFAAAVAARLGTEHAELTVTETYAQQVIPRLAGIFDEPFADTSAIPTFLVCEFARRNVTVALTGDGGDEFFSGYDRYRELAASLSVRSRSAFMRRLASVTAGQLHRLTKVPAVRCSQRLLPGKLGRADVTGRLLRSKLVHSELSPATVHSMLGARWLDPLAIAPGADPGAGWPVFGAGISSALSSVRQAMLVDALQYLPDEVLTKVDRASMAVSLEVRSPLLDYRVVELAFGAPDGFLFDAGRGKLPLRRLLARYLPVEVFERPKMGFGIPLATWLRGPLRDWAGDLLTADSVARQGYLNPRAVQQLLQEHLSGYRDWSYHLWAILMFQQWLGEQTVQK